MKTAFLIFGQTIPLFYINVTEISPRRYTQKKSKGEREKIRCSSALDSSTSSLTLQTGSGAAAG